MADTEHALCESAGVWQKKRWQEGNIWVSFALHSVTDENGVVTDVIEKVKTKEASEQLFAILDNRFNPNPA